MFEGVDRAQITSAVHFTVNGIGYGKKYNPSTENLGFSVGQFEVYYNKTIPRFWTSYIFVPAEAIQKSEGNFFFYCLPTKSSIYCQFELFLVFESTFFYSFALSNRHIAQVQVITRVKTRNSYLICSLRLL